MPYFRRYFLFVRLPELIIITFPPSTSYHILDLPQSNLEFGQNKKSTPVFMVFDVSPMSDGSMVNNIREVRMKGAPSMTWGYIDGTRHHLGFAKSQGMSSANKFPGYEIWMKDRCDVFIEDLSRTVLIEEIPQF